MLFFLPFSKIVRIFAPCKAGKYEKSLLHQEATVWQELSCHHPRRVHTFCRASEQIRVEPRADSRTSATGAAIHTFLYMVRRGMARAPCQIQGYGKGVLQHQIREGSLPSSERPDLSGKEEALPLPVSRHEAS